MAIHGNSQHGMWIRSLLVCPFVHTHIEQQTKVAWPAV